MKQKCLIILLSLLFCISCQSQEKTTSKDMNKNNPLICDPKTGLCEIPEANKGGKIEELAETKEKPIHIVYFTDPICSACWGIEGELRKMKLEYGDDFTIEYRMGGLLPAFTKDYNAGGITSPTDVAHHWDEASDYYQMPIDGNIWLEDPLSSSYPPSMAFKVAELQDKDKAVVFLRIMREMLFLQKKNISKWEVIEVAGNQAGLDVILLKKDYEEKGSQLLQEDLDLSRKMRVRGFPTLYFFNKDGLQDIVYGARSYDDFRRAIKKTNNESQAKVYPKNVSDLADQFGSLTIKELVVLGDINTKDAENDLLDLENKGKLTRITSRKGNLWKLKK